MVLMLVPTSGSNNSLRSYAVCAIDVLTSEPVQALPLTYRSMGFQGKVASSDELTRSSLDIATILICEWQELADLIDGTMKKRDSSRPATVP